MMMRRKKKAQQNKMRYLIAKLNPRSPITEQYRTVRTNLQFSAVDGDVQTILLTSAKPSEGKSMTSANLAVVYAQQGKKVLLIDADLRKPTVHYTFRLSNLKGLSNVLVGQAKLHDVVSASDVENLDLLSCGPIPPNPSELLGSKKMQEMIMEARESYDVILLDTPPILAVTDAQILANISDGSILVVRSGKTEYEAANKAIESLQAANAKVLGTILNDREKKEMNYYYYYGRN